MHLTVTDDSRLTELVLPTFFPGMESSPLSFRHLQTEEELGFSVWIRPFSEGTVVELTPNIPHLGVLPHEIFFHLGTPTLSEVFSWFHSWTTQEWLTCYRSAVREENWEKIPNISKVMSAHWQEFSSPSLS